MARLPPAQAKANRRAAPASRELTRLRRGGPCPRATRVWTGWTMAKTRTEARSGAESAGTLGEHQDHRVRAAGGRRGADLPVRAVQHSVRLDDPDPAGGRLPVHREMGLRLLALLAALRPRRCSTAASCSACRTGATSPCSARPTTPRSTTSSASSACPATTSRCGAASSTSTVQKVPRDDQGDYTAIDEHGTADASAPLRARSLPSSTGGGSGTVAARHPQGDRRGSRQRHRRLCRAAGRVLRHGRQSRRQRRQPLSAAGRHRLRADGEPGGEARC